MDNWLKEHLVCLRDHNSLKLETDTLVCPFGHTYPCIDDIPVMLLEEFKDTSDACCRTLEQIKNKDSIHNFDDERGEIGAVDPFVQRSIAATCGTMYIQLANRLKSYPIPDLPLTQGFEQYFLDLGCNWGRWCINAAQKGYVPIGIDPSLDAIMAARRIVRQLGITAHYVVADARRLPFAKGSFDVVFSYSVLQHFKKDDVKASLLEISRVLKMPGLSMIQMPNKFGLRNLHSQFIQGFRAPLNFDVRYWSIREISDLFSRLIGPTSICVDGFFSLNPQSTCKDIFPFWYRMLINCSDILRRASKKIRWLLFLADSLYVKSIKISSLK